jgi:hypothetical protein
MKILKKMVLVVVLVGFICSFSVHAINTKTKFGIGFQSSLPAWGISGSMDLKNSKLCVQGVLGMVSELKTIAGKVVYKFKEKESYNTYGYGMIGIWSFENESSLGFGGGVGIEFDWRALSKTLPEIWWNLEIGIASVNLNYYNYSAFSMGLGVHYRF